MLLLGYDEDACVGKTEYQGDGSILSDWWVEKKGCRIGGSAIIGEFVEMSVNAGTLARIADAVQVMMMHDAVILDVMFTS